jgi:hypothetical protein
VSQRAPCSIAAQAGASSPDQITVRVFNFQLNLATLFLTALPIGAAMAQRSLLERDLTEEKDVRSVVNSLHALGRQRHAAHDDRHTRFNNTGFLRGDQLDGVAQHLAMIEPDGRDHADGRRHDIRRI